MESLQFPSGEHNELIDQLLERGLRLNEPNSIAPTLKADNKKYVSIPPWILSEMIWRILFLN